MLELKHKNRAEVDGFQKIENIAPFLQDAELAKYDVNPITFWLIYQTVTWGVQRMSKMWTNMRELYIYCTCMHDSWIEINNYENKLFYPKICLCQLTLEDIAKLTFSEWLFSRPCPLHIQAYLYISWYNFVNKIPSGIFDIGSTHSLLPLDLQQNNMVPSVLVWYCGLFSTKSHSHFSFLFCWFIHVWS